MGSDHRRVDHHPIKVRLLERLKDGLPSPLLRPAVKALIHGVVFAEPLGEVRPRGPSTGDPVHRVHETPIVLGIAARISGLAGKQRFDPFVLVVGKFVASSHQMRAIWGRKGQNSPVDADLETKMPLP